MGFLFYFFFNFAVFISSLSHSLFLTCTHLHTNNFAILGTKIFLEISACTVSFQGSETNNSVILTISTIHTCTYIWLKNTSHYC